MGSRRFWACELWLQLPSSVQGIMPPFIVAKVTSHYTGWGVGEM